MEGGVVTAVLLRGPTPHCEGRSGSGSSEGKHSRGQHNLVGPLQNITLTGWTVCLFDLIHPRLHSPQKQVSVTLKMLQRMLLP